MTFIRMLEGWRGIEVTGAAGGNPETVRQIG
jgi:hypothetical protein